jgi:hypothetical protein
MYLPAAEMRRAGQVCPAAKNVDRIQNMTNGKRQIDANRHEWRRIPANSSRQQRRNFQMLAILGEQWRTGDGEFINGRSLYVLGMEQIGIGVSYCSTLFFSFLTADPWPEM